MKASDLQRAHTLVYDISKLEDRLAHLTTTYINPAPADQPHKTKLMVSGSPGFSGQDTFLFLMTEPIYLALKEQIEKEITKLKIELAEMGVEYGK